MASTRSSRAVAGSGDVGARCALVVLVLVGLVGLVGLAGCKGHTGGMTPGRAIGRAAGAIATAAVAGAVAGARRNRDRRDGDAWEEESNVPALPMEGELSGAPLRLVRLPTGEAALAPELIVCDDARECVAVAAAECRAVAVRRERAAEVASASCESLPASYVPRCVHDLCRLESLSPEEVASNRAREAGAVEDSTNDASDEATSGGEVPAPPPSYE